MANIRVTTGYVAYRKLLYNKTYYLLIKHQASNTSYIFYLRMVFNYAWRISSSDG